MKDIGKRRLGFVALLAILFLTHWVYYMVSFGILLSDVQVLLELLYLFVFYAMLVLALPSALLIVWMAFGCAGLCFYYGLFSDSPDQSWLLPLFFLSALVFCLSAGETEKNHRLSSALLSALMNLCPWMNAVVAGYLLITGKANMYFSSRCIFGVVALLVIGGLYLVILRVSAKIENGAKRMAQSLRQCRIPFVFAAICIGESVFLAFIFPGVTFSNTMPLLWILDLFILYDQKNPLVCAFVSRFKKRLNAFLTSGNA